MSGLGDPTDRERLARAVVTTYDTASTASAWTLVQQSRTVQSYLAVHPDRGSHAVATALELPRSRIRPWVDGDAKPDAQRAIERLEERDWLDLSWDGERFRALALLVSWIFGGGSINTHYVPQFVVTGESEWIVRRILAALDLQPDRLRAEEPSRATELRPPTDSSLLGRLLVALGAPQGSKHARRHLSLPTWLASAPEDVRLAFARAYVWNRGTGADRRSQPVQLSENRSSEFRRELRLFLERLLDSDAVIGDSKTVYLTAAAAEVIWQPPEVQNTADTARSQ